MNSLVSSIKKSTYFVGASVLLLVVVWYLLSRMEITCVSFPSYDDAQPAIEAGWLPKWLPRSAYDINESHDIDSNISWMSFHFSKSERFYEPFCSVVEKQRTRIPDVRYVKRFSIFVQEMHNELITNTNLQFYDCSEPQWERYLAINERENLAYSWIIPK